MNPDSRMLRIPHTPRALLKALCFIALLSTRIASSLTSQQAAVQPSAATSLATPIATPAPSPLFARAQKDSLTITAAQRANESAVLATNSTIPLPVLLLALGILIILVGLID
jgi:hypothetical protein